VEFIKDFETMCTKKIEKMEVKHALEREDMIRNLKKNVEWLTPDQVNKYKF